MFTGWPQDWSQICSVAPRLAAHAEEAQEAIKLLTLGAVMGGSWFPGLQLGGYTNWLNYWGLLHSITTHNRNKYGMFFFHGSVGWNKNLEIQDSDGRHKYINDSTTLWSWPHRLDIWVFLRILWFSLCHPIENKVIQVVQHLASAWGEEKMGTVVGFGWFSKCVIFAHYLDIVNIVYLFAYFTFLPYLLYEVL